MKTLAPLAVVASLILPLGALRAENPVIVHEWGTFTSLQDENGRAIGGINVDDEPVPPFVYGAGFVHNLPGSGRAFDFGLPPYPPQKGWVPADQDVTMRLETPVIYFYPPKRETGTTALPLSVHVDFHGGLLSQFYPYAETNGFPNLLNPQQEIHLAECVSGLTWTVTQFGSSQMPVQTADTVWTTPREVSAPEIEVKAKGFDQAANRWGDTTEAEHFLFYRGVGHLDSPLKTDSTIRSSPSAGRPDCDILNVISQDPDDESAPYSDSWLVQIDKAGACAFRYFDLRRNRDINGWRLLGPRGREKEAQFAQGNLDELKSSMQAALIGAGLFPDEAAAMLKTWELSYFKSPGLRFFYIVPPTWVDNTLPLTITGAPPQITRVMVGRIELISDEQRAALARLAGEPYPNLMGLKQAAYDAMEKQKLSPKEKDAFFSGARPLTDLGITLSPSVRDYLSLGRFRDALMMHAEQEHPSENFARFIKENGLTAQ